VNLHGRGPQSHRVVLQTRPARLVSFEHPEVPESAGSPRWRQEEHEVFRWCRLLRESDIPADPRRLDLFRPPSSNRTPTGHTIIHPGAGSGSRRWPTERWAAVARAELEAGRRVLLTGTRGEADIALEVAARAALDPGAVLAGGTDLGRLATLVATAGLVMCGDTGIGHLATALATPSVLLFGPTSPARWGPPVDRPQHVVLWAGTEGDPHGREPDRGLLEIGVNDVLGAADVARRRARRFIGSEAGSGTAGTTRASPMRIAGSIRSSS
jgi:ADP-heptose:LPS heptosyltransferase